MPLLTHNRCKQKHQKQQDQDQVIKWSSLTIFVCIWESRQGNDTNRKRQKKWGYGALGFRVRGAPLPSTSTYQSALRSRSCEYCQGKEKTISWMSASTSGRRRSSNRGRATWAAPWHHSHSAGVSSSSSSSSSNIGAGVRHRGGGAPQTGEAPGGQYTTAWASWSVAEGCCMAGFKEPVLREEYKYTMIS